MVVLVMHVVVFKYFRKVAVSFPAHQRMYTRMMSLLRSNHQIANLVTRSIVSFLILLGSYTHTDAQQIAELENDYMFNLQDCLAYAQSHQFNIINAELDEKNAEYKVRETTGIGLPQVNANLDFKDYFKVPAALAPGDNFGVPGKLVPLRFGVQYQAVSSIDVSQLIFDGSYLVGLQAAKTYRELSSKNLKRSKIETVVAVTKAYYAALVNSERVTLLDANIIRLNKSLQDMMAMYQNGFVEKIDADRLQVLLNNLETEKQNALRFLELNISLLKFQMGMPIANKLTLKEKIADLQIDIADLYNTSVESYKNRIEYHLLETQKKLMELDVKRYKMAFLPSVAGYGSWAYQFQQNTFASLFDADYRFSYSLIGLKLSVPIFSGGQKYYRVKQAQWTLKKTENEIDNFKNAVAIDIEQSKTSYINSLASLNSQKRNRELATEIVRVTKAKYEQGVGSGLEVTSAETSLKEAEVNYIGALYDVLISKVNYEKAMGNIAVGNTLNADSSNN